jgi:hypothetical protein
VQMTIGESFDFKRGGASSLPLLPRFRRERCLLRHRENVAIMRKIEARSLRFGGISGTLNTSGITVFGNLPRFGLELWAWKLRLRSSLERAWCPLCADGLS